MKIVYKLMFVFFTICIITVSFNNLFALDILTNIIDEGNRFSDNTSEEEEGLTNYEDFINEKIIPIIKAVGNLIFAIVTVVLGVKYIWSGVQGKSDVKQVLPNFMAAVIFFYLATELIALFDPNEDSTIGDFFQVSNYETLAANIMGTVNFVVKYLAFGGVIFIGVKYMFESADGKAQIKDKLVPVVLGIVLVFCASSVVDFIIAISQQTIHNS